MAVFGDFLTLNGSHGRNIEKMDNIETIGCSPESRQSVVYKIALAGCIA